MSAHRRRLAVVAAVLIAACFAAWFGWYRPLAKHRRWYREVECLIIELAAHRPPDVTPRQWAFCLHNTSNLHGNYGNSSYWQNTRRRDELAVEFRDRLRGKVGIDTIDWFWDAYVQAAPRSKRYIHYRPTQIERLKDAGSQDEYDLNSWLVRRAWGDCPEILNDR